MAEIGIKDGKIYYLEGDKVYFTHIDKEKKQFHVFNKEQKQFKPKAIYRRIPLDHAKKLLGYEKIINDINSSVKENSNQEKK